MTLVVRCGWQVIGLTFLFSIVLMLATFAVVWKMGAIRWDSFALQ